MVKTATNNGLNMSNEKLFDAQKRRSMKILASVAAFGSMANTHAIAGLLSGANADTPGAFDDLECMLILRADNKCLHLLMRNKGEADVVISGFESQALQFDDINLNISDALSQTFTIKSQDRIMVRLNLENSLRAKASSAPQMDVNSVTSLLSQGTRVVAVTARVRQGIGALIKAQEPSLAMMNAWSAMYSSKLQVS